MELHPVLVYVYISTMVSGSEKSSAILDDLLVINSVNLEVYIVYASNILNANIDSMAMIYKSKMK